MIAIKSKSMIVRKRRQGNGMTGKMLMRKVQATEMVDDRKL